MKALDDLLTETRKSIHRCFSHSSSDKNPAIKELIYCSTMFLAEATKAACGCRPRSPGRLAKELEASRAKRMQLYRSIAKSSLSAKLPVNPRNHV
jgi:hypothetical protein